MKPFKKTLSKGRFLALAQPNTNYMGGRGRSELSMTPVVGPDLKTALSTETLDAMLDPPDASPAAPFARKNSFRKMVGSIRSRSLSKIRSRSQSRKNVNVSVTETKSTASNTTDDPRVRPVRICVNRKGKATNHHHHHMHHAEEHLHYNSSRGEKDILLRKTEDLLSAFDTNNAHSYYDGDASSVVDESSYMTYDQYNYDPYEESVFSDDYSDMYGESTTVGDSTTVGGDSSAFGESSYFGISALGNSIFTMDEEESTDLSTVNNDVSEDDDDTAPATATATTVRKKKKIKMKKKQPLLCGHNNVLIMGLMHIVEDVTMCGTYSCAYVVKKAEDTVCGPQQQRRGRPRRRPRGRSR